LLVGLGTGHTGSLLGTSDGEGRGLAPFLDLVLSPECIEVALGKEGLGDQAIWVLVSKN